MIITTAELHATLEAIRAPDAVKHAATPLAGPTRYYLPCWRCRRPVAVAEAIFDLHDATTCPACRARKERR